MLNANVDINDMLRQGVHLNIVSCIRLYGQQILDSQITIIRICVIFVAGNTRIHSLL